jgi:hypothetical protein
LGMGGIAGSFRIKEQDGCAPIASYPETTT